MTNKILPIILGFMLIATGISAQQIDVEIQSGSSAGLQIKHLASSSAATLNLLNDNNKLLDIGITGSANNFFGNPNTAYLFTRLNDQVPIAFATDGKERMRLTEFGTLALGTSTPGVSTQKSSIWIEPEDGDRGITIDYQDTTTDNNAIWINYEAKSAAIKLFANGNSTGIHVIADSSYAITCNGESDPPVICSVNTGYGPAGSFEIDNFNSLNTALYCGTTGMGYALEADGRATKTDGNQYWTLTSDRRVKKNIQPFQDGLELILKVNPKKFIYNGLFGTKKDQPAIGIIAQEIQKIAPYMVDAVVKKKYPNDPENREKIDDLLVYNGSALPYILVNAIKEMNQTIEKQKVLLASQSGELKNLRKQMVALEKKVKETPSIEITSKY